MVRTLVLFPLPNRLRLLSLRVLRDVSLLSVLLCSLRPNLSTPMFLEAS